MRDKIAVFLSGLCLVHCFALPVIMLLTGFSILGEAHSEWVHAVLMVPILLLACYSLPKGWKRSGARRLIYCAIIGVYALLLALVLKERYELLFSLIGSLALVYAHLYSLRVSSQTPCDHSS